MPLVVLGVLCLLSPSIRAQTLALWRGSEWQYERWAFPGNSRFTYQEAVQKCRVFWDPETHTPPIPTASGTRLQRDRLLAGLYLAPLAGKDPLRLRREVAKGFPGDTDLQRAAMRTVARRSFPYPPDPERDICRDPDTLRFLRGMQKEQPENAYPVLLELAVVYGGYLHYAGRTFVRTFGETAGWPRKPAASQETRWRQDCLDLIRRASRCTYYDDEVRGWALQSLQTYEKYRPIAVGERIAILDNSAWWNLGNSGLRHLESFLAREAQMAGFPSRNRRQVLVTAIELLKVSRLVNTERNRPNGTYPEGVERFFARAALRPFMSKTGSGRYTLQPGDMAALTAMARAERESGWATEFQWGAEISSPRRSLGVPSVFSGTDWPRHNLVPMAVRDACWLYEDAACLLAGAALSLAAIGFFAGVLLLGNRAPAAPLKARLAIAGLTVALTVGLGALSYFYIVAARLTHVIDFWLDMADSFRIVAAILALGLPWLGAQVMVRRKFAKEMQIARRTYLGTDAGNPLALLPLDFPALICWGAAFVVVGTWLSWGMASNAGQVLWWRELRAQDGSVNDGPGMAMGMSQMILASALAFSLTHWRFGNNGQPLQIRQYALRMWRDTLGVMAVVTLWLAVLALSLAPMFHRMVNAAL